MSDDKRAACGRAETGFAEPEAQAKRPVKKPAVRRLVLGAVFLLMCAGIVFNGGVGTVSSFGRDFVATVCPLGALEAMAAAKLLIPQGLVFLVVVAVVLALLGKVFCSWICPIPPIRSVIDSVANRTPRTKGAKDADSAASSGAAKPLSSEEMRLVKRADACESAVVASGAATEGDKPASRCTHACGSCASRTQRPPLDSRHVVLGGTLLSAAVFGFPVFCLVCPIGLTFASIVVLVQLFGSQTLSWGVLLFPLLLVLELTVLRTWCTKICPMGALFSLLSIPNRLFRPKVDMKKCLRGKGVDCRICADVCPEGLDPHHTKHMQDCSKCRDCASNCPAQAIKFPLA